MADRPTRPAKRKTKSTTRKAGPRTTKSHTPKRRISARHDEATKAPTKRAPKKASRTTKKTGTKAAKAGAKPKRATKDEAKTGRSKPKAARKTKAAAKDKAKPGKAKPGKAKPKAARKTKTTTKRTAKPKRATTAKLIAAAVQHRTLKKGSVKVGKVTVRRGEKRIVHLKVSEHYTGQAVDIPVTVIRGRRRGPRLFLTAAVHGDEINGVQIIREVIDQIGPDELKGTIIAAPVVNRFGFVSHSRYMPDRRDLNRCFPGSPDGPTAFRYAHQIFKNIIAPCDYGIDLHTAGYQRHNLPQIRGNMDHPDIKRLAKAFGAEVIMDKPGAKGTLRQAATEAGVPTIIYEAGETFRFQREPITKGVTGVLNVLKDLGMLEGEPERPAYQVVTKTSAWIRADHGGIIETYVDAGTIVHAGEAIAQVTEPFGASRGTVKAPFDGLVVGITTLPMVNPGAPICHLVKLKRHLETVREAVGPDIVSIHGPEHPLDIDEVIQSAGTPEEDENEG